MTKRLLAVAPALAVLVLAGCGTSGTDANDDSGSGCYGPWLDTDPSGEPPDGAQPVPDVNASPGTTVTVYGHGYTATCDDTAEGGAAKPLGAVELTLGLPDGTRQPLGRFTPRVENGDAGFVAEFTVPAAAKSGTAVVSDDRSPAATYRISIHP